MHEPFDEELRERLRKYAEEPDKDLWKGIAPHIVSVNPGTGYVVWTHMSTVIVSLSFLISGYQPVAHIPVGNQAISSVLRETNDCILQINTSAGKMERTNIGYEQNEQSEALNKNTGPLKSKTLFPEINNATTIFAMNQMTAEEKEAHPKEERSLALFVNEPTSIKLSDSIETISTIMDNPGEQKKEKQQKRNTKTKKIVSFKNPTLYFTVMPTFGHQRIEANTYAFSSKRLGVRIEIGAEWPLGKKLKVFSGLLSYHQNQTISYTEKQLDYTIVIPGSNPGEFIVQPVYSDVQKTIVHELKNLGVQVGLIYKLSKNRDKTFGELEVLTETLPIQKKKFVHWVGTGIEFHKAINKTNESNGFYDPTIYVFGNIYYRLQYPNVGRLKAVLQPTFNYSFFMNQDLNSSFYVKPYGLGLNFGLTYSF